MRMNLVINRRLWSIVFRCLLLASACAAGTQVQASVYQDDTKEFETQIQKYLALQKKAVGTVPSIPRENTDAALIAKHEKQIADAIRAARPNAKQGEIFTPGARRLITMAIKQTLEGKEGAAAKATILGEGNPKSDRISGSRESGGQCHIPCCGTPFHCAPFRADGFAPIAEGA